MRIGILSYPMLFQRDSNLRTQVRATMAAFERMRPSALYGQVDARLVDSTRESIDDYDVIHVIGASHGNHTVVEMAAACGVPVVVTPLVSSAWTAGRGQRARFSGHWLSRLAGRDIQSGYTQVRCALDCATVVVLQSNAERSAVAAAFLTPPAKLRVLGQGVDQALFAADATLFRQRTGQRGEFALMAGPITPANDHLKVAAALYDMAVPLFVTGPSHPRDDAYLHKLRSAPGVRLLGDLCHQPQLRASLFAAANFLVLPPGAAACRQSAHGALEALAAGTAVLADRASAHALPDSDAAVRRLRWHDHRARPAAIVSLLEAPPLRARLRELVRDHGWDLLADRLLHCYADAIALRGPDPGVYGSAPSVRKLLDRAPR
jgi:hypothetical protein